MRYVSTRGQAPVVDFADALLAGLARDGGLYVPESWPALAADEIRALSGVPYAEAAYRVTRPFVGDSIPDAAYRAIIEDTYARFDHAATAPLVQLAPNHWLLELFHGPTIAFKDYAMQLLGNLFNHVLGERGKRVTIVGATSGDTGSAAIEACKDRDAIDVFILYPHNRVSEVQRRQMTTVPGDNVNSIAIEGNFDDCQNIVKQAFADQGFLPAGYQLVAVNSINFSRIMAQIVYYFYAALKITGGEKPVSFSVPTGNFGDIYAGYLAKKMGLPVDRLIIATNKNDILHRFISSNQYNLGNLEPSLSPSMDIMVSSNFERFLFDLFEGNTEQVTAFVTGLGRNAQQVTDAQWQFAKDIFDSCRVDDDTTCNTISEVFAANGYLLDPHTATGVKAARVCCADNPNPVVCLATAHPAKFADAITRAGLKTPALPPHLADLMEREERMTVLPAELSAVTGYIKKTL